jgi:hypothetical protein
MSSNNNLVVFSTVFFPNEILTLCLKVPGKQFLLVLSKTQLSLLQLSKTKIVLDKCDHKDFITHICLTWKNVSVGKSLIYRTEF